MSEFKETIREITGNIMDSVLNGYTDEMVKWYEERTNKHIELVCKYINKLPDMLPSEKLNRCRKHDQSKFKTPEYEAYIWITWKYKCLGDKKDFESFNPPSNIGDHMNIATHHHITTNSHHPEYHSADQTGLLNRDDRDKPPAKQVDATNMPDLDIMEMCADWSAMSEERGTNTPHEWAKSNVNVRWKFTKEQEELIYKTLDSIWDK